MGVAHRFVSFCAGLCCLVAAASPTKAADWSDYQIIMWQPESAAGYRELQEMGFTAAALGADRNHPERLHADPSQALIQAHMPWYVENIASDFYSAYHRYFPDREPNWRFLATKNLYLADRDDPAALMRDPSLSDPEWLERIAARLRLTVEANRRYRPLFYNLADEAGIADLNAFWDFDFSPQSLAAMRDWLKSHYPSLAALNTEWGTGFTSWDAVVPPTTPQTMRRTDGNFAAWSDFKHWMDVAFARAFAAGRTALAAADPDALAGLEGGQKPGWGGYDYATLAPSVDVMETEPALFPLVRSLNPKLRLLSTSFRGGPVEEHRIWRALLDGGRGIIVWDAKRQFVGADGLPRDRGRMAAPYLRELRDGVGALIIKSDKAPSRVAILYSPESMRVQWLLDWKQKGDAWLDRGADAEDHDDNTVRDAMDAFERSFQALGYSPTFVTARMLEGHALDSRIRVLVLPHAIALSEAAADTIRRFTASGGTVIADTMPGVYDEHGKKRSHPVLAALFPNSHDFIVPQQSLIRQQPDAADPPLTIGPSSLEAIARLAGGAGLSPELRVTDANGVRRTDVQVWTFRNGAITLFAVLQDVPSVERRQVFLAWPREGYVYDVRRGQPIEKKTKIEVSLPEAGPLILALSPHPLPRLKASATWVQGEPQLHVDWDGEDGAARHVLHVTGIGSPGQMETPRPVNITLPSGETTVRLPWAFNTAAPGLRITVSDLLLGQTVETSVEGTP